MSEAKGSESGGKSSSSESKSSSSESKSSSSESKSSSSEGSGGKSARESVGGVSDVHYGYFSSVRNKKYRSGWEAIWGKENKKKSTTRVKGPIDIDLNFDDLPEELQSGLAESVRKKLRRTPNGFRKLQEARALEWQISVRIGK